MLQVLKMSEQIETSEWLTTPCKYTDLGANAWFLVWQWSHLSHSGRGQSDSLHWGAYER